MNFINLRISGEKLDFDEINSVINVSNVVCHKKGEVHVYKNQEVTFGEDVWITHFEVGEDKNLEIELEQFINKIYESRFYISKLCLENDISLWVTVYPDTYQLNLHLSGITIKRIYEFGIDFDLSIMCLNELY